MIDRPRTYLPGAEALASALDALAKDGQSILAKIAVGEPRWSSAGGHEFPPRAFVTDGNLVVLVQYRDQVQRFACTPASTITRSAALAEISARLATYNGSPH